MKCRIIVHSSSLVCCIPFFFLPEDHLSLRFLCVASFSYFPSDLQNHEIIFIRRNHWRSSGPLPTQKQGYLQTYVRLLSALPGPGASISKGGHSMGILFKGLTTLTVKSIWSVTHVPLCIYKVGVFPHVNIQNLVVNLDGKVVWSCEKGGRELQYGERRKIQVYSFIEGSRRDGDEQE